MITPKEIEEKTMTPAKRAMAHNDYFAFYIGCPISYLLTIPFLYTKVTPNQVTMLSLVPLLIAFVMSYLGSTTYTFLWTWFFFFLWNLLDGVDGNMARYRKQFSRMGSVYDAMIGYVAMILQPFAWGIVAAHIPGSLSKTLALPDDVYIVLGALSGIFVIFPRFIMHKAISQLGGEDAVKGVKDKSSFSLSKTIALNMTSATGFVQVFMLVSIFFNAYDFFTLAYFFINGGVMIFSLVSIFKNS